MRPSDAPHRRYIIVHGGGVYVRSQPSTQAQTVGFKFVGDELTATSEVNGWLELADGSGWVLRDGSQVGLGALLKPMSDSDDSDLPPLCVSANDGLCNRLRVVLSYASIALRRKRPLVVVWPVQNLCNGRFEDAFQPLPGVTFVQTPPVGVRPAFAPRSHDFHPEVRACGEGACTACFSLLKPNDAVAERVEANLRSLGESFISLHVRRTDHWGSSTTDDDYLSFVAKHAAVDAFLATDNAKTQARFLQSPAHGHRIKTTTRIVADLSKLRQTSIADAAVDIFTCAAADGPFKGCYTSSFSDAILRIRQLSGRARSDDEHVLTDSDLQMSVTLDTPGGHAEHSPGQPMQSTTGQGHPDLQRLRAGSGSS